MQYWPGTTSEELLVQFFAGGSEGRSAIVLKDGRNIAYLLPGKWLAMYESLGGPELAGYPISDA